MAGRRCTNDAAAADRPGYARRNRHIESPASGGTVRLVSRGPAVTTAPVGARLSAGVRMRAALALLTALVGGLALAAAFPPAGIWPLAAVGPALLTVALWRQR